MHGFEVLMAGISRDSEASDLTDSTVVIFACVGKIKLS
jgi:hypothetical protein